MIKNVYTILINSVCVNKALIQLVIHHKVVEAKRVGSEDKWALRLTFQSVPPNYESRLLN